MEVTEIIQASEDHKMAPPPPPPLPPLTAVPSTKISHKTSEKFEPIRVHFAINCGDVTEVRRLIAAGVDLNFDARGNTPLTLSILNQSFEIAGLLVEALLDVDLLIPERTPWRRQPIHLAVRSGNLQLVRRIIARCPSSVHATDAMLFTPLHWAAARNAVDIARILIDAGAHINVLDDRGRSALHRATEQDHFDMVRLLLDEGAFIERRDHAGWTPLFHAVVCGMTDITRLLLESGASANTTNNSAQTSLHAACGRIAQRNILVLSQTGLDFYLRDCKAGGPSVIRAMSNKTVDFAQVWLLLDYGAAVNVKDVQGKTPLEIAIDFRQTDIIRLLRLAGSDLCIISRLISTPDWPPQTIAEDTELCDWLVQAVEVKVRPLTDLCKFAIRKGLGRNIDTKIARLPIPTSLQEFCRL